MKKWSRGIAVLALGTVLAFGTAGVAAPDHGMVAQAHGGYAEGGRHHREHRAEDCRGQYEYRCGRQGHHHGEDSCPYGGTDCREDGAGYSCGGAAGRACGR